MDVHSELRLVTCLFVDIVGSTDATVRVGPERMQRLLGEAFTEMSGTITAHGGTVEKYVGDAIFALFGAPVAHADDAERALRAAEECAGWSSARDTSTARLGVRVGIETGEALVDLAAVDQRQRMAVGDCVNIAARLQQHAAPGEIIVGPTCHEATTRVAQFESVGGLSLKGLGEVDAWRFTEFDAGDDGPQVAFVGRGAELRLMGDAFDRASHGTSTLALIVGPPGQGKSRLVGEAIRTWRSVRTIEARCRPGAEAGMNTPLRQLLDADVPDASPDGVRDRLSALLGVDEGGKVAAAVCHSAGLAVDEHLLAIPRMEQRVLIAQAWRRYLAAVAREGTLIVWIDDIHWADPVLLRIVDHLTSEVQAPILVIATARPEFAGSAHLRPHQNRLQIDLEPLDRDSAELLAHTAGDARIDAARAAGNPLFIIELARSHSGSGEMPMTIQAAIAARLDELSPPERELLQRASVAGETFDLRDAALLGDREPAEVAGLLGRVAHLGFVAPAGSRYRFHHALVREVAYGRLPVAERMALHARHAADGVDPADCESLAHHWWEAVKPPDAEWVWQDPARLTELRRAAFGAQLAAGRRLEERNAYEDALDPYTRAVELADSTADLASAQAAIGRAYARQGRGDEAWEHRLRALDTYAHDIALAEVAVGRAYARQGRGDEAWEHRLRAIKTFTKARSDPPGELYADMLEIATMNWGYFQHLPEDAEVLRLIDEGERIARSSGDDVALARLMVERALYTNDATGADEIARFTERPDAVRFADAAHRMAQVYLWNGKIAQAMELYETVFERLVPAGAAINEPEAMVWCSLAAFNAGELARADALADRLLEEARQSRRSAHTRQHAYGLKALLLLARGDWDGVTATTRELAQLVDANPDTGFCLVGSAAAGYGAIAEILAGRPLPIGLDAFVAQMIPEETLIQASSLMLPKVMASDPPALTDGLRAYAPELRLWDRQRVWDVCDLMPAIALTMLQRWDELGPSLARLDACAGGGGRVADAVAAAVREEEAAAQGGPPPTHGKLHALGCDGISELLRFRPRDTSVAAPADAR